MQKNLRELIGEHLNRLAEGEVAPDEAADWALSVMEQESTEDIDPKLWRALDQLAGADLLEAPGAYLHGREDFACWRAEFEAERR
ncbi:DNA-binding protein [Streptomyces sp. NPDC052079]|uniref:DNA-binding protein n=1 Tax=Streptomyces sp. NPDC052079 TaxID=3155526 RepID=UPI00343036D2